MKIALLAFSRTPSHLARCTRRDLNPHTLRFRNLNPVHAYRHASKCRETRVCEKARDISLHFHPPWTIGERMPLRPWLALRPVGRTTAEVRDSHDLHVFTDLAVHNRVRKPAQQNPARAVPRRPPL